MIHIKKVVISILSLLLFTMAGDGKNFSISLKGGMFFPTSKNFSGPLVDSLNRRLADMTSLFGEVDFLEVRSQEMDKVSNIFIWGVEGELYVKKRISIAFGVEYWKDSNASLFEASSTFTDLPYFYKRTFKVNMTLLPIQGTVRYHFPLKNFDAYAGAGAGFYTETVQGFSTYVQGFSTYEMDISEEGEDLYWKAKGRAILPHIDSGVTYEIFRSLGIGFGIKYVFGEINEFEVKESRNAELVGNLLTLITTDGITKKFEQSILGFHVGVMLRLSF